MEQDLITYAHRDDPDGTRYRQYAADPVPVWAVDIKPEVPEVVQPQTKMPKRWRPVMVKSDQIKVAYGKDPVSKDLELQYCWGDNPGGGRRDVNMLMHHWNNLKGHDGKSFIEELEARGYDITTLKFTIERKK